MKKRKSPIFLVTVLFVLVVIACAFNISSVQSDKGPTPPSASASDAKLGEARAPEAPSSVAGSVKAAMAKPMSAKPDQDERSETLMMARQSPLVARKPAAATKPTPNESSISTQWYSSETAKPSGK